MWIIFGPENTAQLPTSIFISNSSKRKENLTFKLEKKNMTIKICQGKENQWERGTHTDRYTDKKIHKRDIQGNTDRKVHREIQTEKYRQRDTDREIQTERYRRSREWKTKTDKDSNDFKWESDI